MTRNEYTVDELADVLLRAGFVECNIAACNCGSWHHRYGLPERFSEIKDALMDAGVLNNETGNLPIRAIAKLVEQRDALRSRLAEAERDMDQLIGERDHAQGMADKLADAIATLLGVEIGEHSNMNCPWTQALEAFEDRPTASTSGPKCERCSDTGWIQGDPVFGISDEPCGCAEAEHALGVLVRVARQHRFCGDQYPANGWPDVNEALATYAALRREDAP